MVGKRPRNRSFNLLREDESKKRLKTTLDTSSSSNLNLGNYFASESNLSLDSVLTTPNSHDPVSASTSFPQLSYLTYPTHTQQRLTDSHVDLISLFDTFSPGIAPEDRLPTPTSMTHQLKDYQRIGLDSNTHAANRLPGVTWMSRMESGKHHGGILSDEMGLGKTIQAIACILTSRSPPLPSIFARSSTPLSPQPCQNSTLGDGNESEAATTVNDFGHRVAVPRSTLIILPLTLLDQWRCEIEQFIERDCRLSVLQYHSGFLTARERMSFVRNPKKFNDYDGASLLPWDIMIFGSCVDDVSVCCTAISFRQANATKLHQRRLLSRSNLVRLWAAL